MQYNVVVDHVAFYVLHGITGVIAGLLKHIQSPSNSINMVQYGSYNPKLTI